MSTNKCLSIIWDVSSFVLSTFIRSLTFLFPPKAFLVSSRTAVEQSLSRGNLTNAGTHGDLLLLGLNAAEGVGT